MALKLSIFTLGCRVNHYESASIADAARAEGFETVPWGEKADACIINSCAITALAEAKTRQAARIFARANPDSPIVLTGCYAQTSPSELLKLPNVKRIVGNREKPGAVNALKMYLAADCKNAPIPAARESMSGSLPLSDRMNLKIQDGCDNACSYCIIPRARGTPKSRSFGEIVADAENLVSRGVREIILTGINISKFEVPEGGLTGLLDRLNNISELLRLRIGSIEPPHPELEALLERMADPSHKLAPHLHMSVQSLSDNVLIAMRRKYPAEEFLKSLEMIRGVSEYISVGTDIICGHPGETEKDFEITKRRLLGSGAAYAHIFTFSPRAGTLAAAMKDQVPTGIRKRRSDEMRKVAAALREAFIAKNIGKTRKILLENRLKNGEYMAYTDNYIQVSAYAPEPGLKNRLAYARIAHSDGNGNVRAQIEKII